MVTRKQGQRCLVAAVLFSANALCAAEPAAGDRAAPDKAVLARGRELFGRQWQLNDARSPAGDGLGPVFNASSCMACHNQAGVGGAGSNAANVRVITRPPATTTKKASVLHPGFKTQTSLVLHHNGAEQGYNAWRDRLIARTKDAPAKTESDSEQIPPQLRAAMNQYQQGLQRGAEALSTISGQPNPFFNAEPAPQRNRLGWDGGMMIGAMRNADPPSQSVVVPTSTLSVSERNSTALFGAGLIDRIPEAAIDAVAAEQKAQMPRIAGRVPKLPNQRIGRFGWHAQQASLADFTLTACAVELGLSVPGHPQAGNPRKPKYQPPGLDMTADECTALVAYLAALPRPEESRAGGQPVEAGRRTFERTGCADCHRPNLEGVDGLYSDLLMHDMGPDLKGDVYGAFVVDDDAAPAAEVVWHGSSEWRTPPLWGVASSAPYLHDGRAATLRDAIAAHGGQAAASAKAFADLPAPDRKELIEFLRSLVAPTSAERNRELENNRRGGWGSNRQNGAGKKLHRRSGEA